MDVAGKTNANLEVHMLRLERVHRHQVGTPTTLYHHFTTHCVRVHAELVSRELLDVKALNVQEADARSWIICNLPLSFGMLGQKHILASNLVVKPLAATSIMNQDCDIRQQLGCLCRGKHHQKFTSLRSQMSKTKILNIWNIEMSTIATT